MLFYRLKNNNTNLLRFINEKFLNQIKKGFYVQN